MIYPNVKFIDTNENKIPYFIGRVSRQEDVDFLFNEFYEDIDKKSILFLKKWGINSRHITLFEHKIFHFLFSDISMFMAKVIEDCRTGSYIEKSSRYKKFNSNILYYLPLEIYDINDIKKREVLSLLYDLYNNFEDKLKFNKKELSNTDIKDRIRYLLPSITPTNVAVTGNLLTFIKIMNKLEIKFKNFTEAGIIVDKFESILNNIDSEIYKIYLDLKNILFEEEKENNQKKSQFYEDIFYDNDKIFLYKNYNERFENILSIDNIPERELELFNFVSGFIIDFGAWRDIQRHRMKTDFVSNSYCGYSYPEDFNYISFDYEMCINKIYKLINDFDNLYNTTDVYITPLAFNRKVVMQFDLREFIYMYNLRTTKYSHFSYKKFFLRLKDKFENLYPDIFYFIKGKLNSEFS